MCVCVPEGWDASQQLVGTCVWVGNTRLWPLPWDVALARLDWTTGGCPAAAADTTGVCTHRLRRMGVLLPGAAARSQGGAEWPHACSRAGHLEEVEGRGRSVPVFPWSHMLTLLIGMATSSPKHSGCPEPKPSTRHSSWPVWSTALL